MAPRRPKIRIIVAGVLLTIVAVAVVHVWYFREVAHSKIASPDGRWLIVVTKRMHDFPEPVAVRFKIIPNWDHATVQQDLDLDEPDVWEDIQPDSYRVEWISSSEFRVAGRQPGSSALFEGRLVTARSTGEFWVVQPANSAER